jgi:hypothetical protein
VCCGDGDDQDDAILMGLLRLRVTDADAAKLRGQTNVRTPSHVLPEFAARPVARIRELHVYGNLRMVNPNTHGADADRCLLSLRCTGYT